MKRFALMALASGMAIAAATPASATIFLAYSTDGGVTKTAITNDGGTGVLNFNGNFGGYFNNISAIGAPAMLQPTILTQSIDVQQSAASLGGTLILYITQTDLSTFSGMYNSSFTANSATGSASSVTLSTLFDATNGTGAGGLYTGTTTASATFAASPFAQSSTTLSGQTFTGPFSQTAQYTLTFNAGNGSVNDTINILGTAVPEPATWGMMIMGFGMLGGVMRRRSTKVAFA